jgi:hypothetical protein
MVINKVIKKATEMEQPCFSVLGVYSRAAVAVDSIPCSQTGRSYLKLHTILYIILKLHTVHWFCKNMY